MLKSPQRKTISFEFIYTYILLLSLFNQTYILNVFSLNINCFTKCKLCYFKCIFTRQLQIIRKYKCNTYVTSTGTSAILGYRFTQTSTLLSKLVTRCMRDPKI